jgi:hypothetical protein
MKLQKFREYCRFNCRDGQKSYLEWFAVAMSRREIRPYTVPESCDVISLLLEIGLTEKQMY